MNDEKWRDTLIFIKDKFGLDEERTEDLEDAPGSKDIVEFKGPLGKMKLERITKPVVLDKKTQYSNRIGGPVKVDYVYSETEKTQKIKAYRWNEEQNDWQEVEAERLIGV